MEGMSADGMDSSFMTIFGEFLEGYSKCAKMAGTTPEQFQFSLGTLIKARREEGLTSLSIARTISWKNYLEFVWDNFVISINQKGFTRREGGGGYLLCACFSRCFRCWYPDDQPGRLTGAISVDQSNCPENFRRNIRRDSTPV